MKTKHAAVLKDGEKVYVGNAGKDEAEYGLVLEALEDGGFGCDLFFRNDGFAGHLGRHVAVPGRRRSAPGPRPANAVTVTW